MGDGLSPVDKMAFPNDEMGGREGIEKMHQGLTC